MLDLFAACDDCRSRALIAALMLMQARGDDVVSKGAALVQSETLRAAADSILCRLSTLSDADVPAPLVYDAVTWVLGIQQPQGASVGRPLRTEHGAYLRRR
jgi:hypothetical protein